MSKAPAFMSHYKSKKKLVCNIDISPEIAKNPYDEFWIQNSNKSNVDVFTYYHNFLNKYFKKNKKGKIFECNTGTKTCGILNKKDNKSNLFKDEEQIYNNNEKDEVLQSDKKEKQILEFIKEGKSWLEMGFETGKHPIDCIKIYNKQIKKSREKWTSVEDALLLNLVKIYGPGKWKIISTFFNNKSNVQCMHRYRKIKNENVKGKWSKAEDNLLKKAIEKFGDNRWSLVSQIIKNRNESQCRERWKRQLKKNIKKGKWDKNEDLKLKSLVNIYGKKWSKIAEHMVSRNDHQCKKRWKIIKNKATE